MKPYVHSRNTFPPTSPVLQGGEEDESWKEGGDKKQQEMASGSDGEPAAEEASPRSPESVTVKKEVEEPSKGEAKVRVVARLAADPARTPSPAQDDKTTLDYLKVALPPPIQPGVPGGRFILLPDGSVPSKPPEPPDPRPGALGYLCTPCGIRFSSASTLEAHQTYYCSHRVIPRPEPPTTASTRNSGESDCEEGRSVSGDSVEGGPTPAKMARTTKLYRCPHCSYSADKKVSLNRHMRMHSASPPEEHSTPPTNLVDRYCQDCDIRFSSIKTYRAHKTHYCGTRHSGKTKSPPGSPVSPPAPPPVKPFLVLPTSPVLVVPYGLVQGASVVSGPAAASIQHTDTVSILLPDGSLQPLPLAIAAANSSPNNKLTKSGPSGTSNSNSEPVGERSGEVRETSSPLDLSYRRSTPDPEDKENRVENRVAVSPEHEDIVCAPSIPLMLSTSSTSSSPSPLSPASSASGKKSGDGRAASPRPAASPKSPRPNGVLGKKDELQLLLAAVAHNHLAKGPDTSKIGAPLLPYLPPELALRMVDLPPPPPPPPVLVKHGESKCTDCNIVFYRIENFIAHKMYYCSKGMSVQQSDPEKSPTGSPPPAPAPSTSKLPVYQFICAACGIKFTSYDNLTAHQTYYCPKRANVEDKLRRCAKCKAVGITESHCCPPAGSVPTAGTVVGTAAGWKCPCCPVTSATAAQAQKHMESHQGVKAFLCTICSYKGNTLRGMRTHIRMHFDKKPADVNEENFISCIIDEPVGSSTAVKTEPAGCEGKQEEVEVNGTDGENEPECRVKAEPQTPPPANPSPTPPADSLGARYCHRANDFSKARSSSLHPTNLIK